MKLETEPLPLPWRPDGASQRERAELTGIWAVVVLSPVKKRGWCAELFVQSQGRLLSGSWERGESGEALKRQCEEYAGLFAAVLGLEVTDGN